jgi:hypothetical protein
MFTVLLFLDQGKKWGFKDFKDGFHNRTVSKMYYLHLATVQSQPH